MRTNFRYIFLWILTVALFASCNKSLVETNDSKVVKADTLIKDKKVLLILIDGAVGAEYKAMALPTLKSLEQNSLYSYDGLNTMTNTFVNTDQSWSNLMTGVTAAKHNVTSSLGTNNFTNYPSFINRLKEVDAGYNVTTVAADGRLSDALFVSADEKFVFTNNDAQVNTKANAVLQNSKAEVVIVHYNSPNTAGLASTYTASSASYTQAAQNVDGYIKQQIDAIKARTTYVKEDWMIMIVSTTGSNVQSTAVPWNAFEDKNHNTLYFYYNPRFQLRSYAKPDANTIIPYTGTSPEYWVNSPQPNNQISKLENNTPDLDLKNTGDFTIQIKIKRFTSANTWYPGFFGKRESFTGAFPGWVFIFDGQNWAFNVSQGGGSRQAMGVNVSDQKWHTLTAVVKTVGGVRTINSYTDGAKNNSTDITGWNIVSAFPLKAGYFTGNINYDPAKLNITDIRIYNVALPDAYISSNYCRVDVSETDTYYQNLLGFWPSLEVYYDSNLSKYYLRDHSSQNRRLVIDNFVRSQFNDSQFGVCPPISEIVYNQAPNAIDVPNQVFSWFGIPVRPSWTLDGKAWIPSYSDTN